MFSSAIGPACVIFYQKELPEKNKDYIIYVTPKPNYKDASFSSLLIDSSDIKFIPRFEVNEKNSKIWKIAMWGTYRDLILIKTLQKNESVEKFIKNDPAGQWSMGCGFQISEPRNKINQEIKKIPFLQASKINKYYTPKENTTNIDFSHFRRLGTPGAYKQPHLIIKKGQTNKEFCATFIDYNCSFKHAVYGIHAREKDNLLKSLTLIFNSKFASYYLFLISSSWGIERDQINSIEFLSLPFLKFLNDDSKVNTLANKYDEVKDLIKHSVLDFESDLKKITDQIDKFIFQEIGLKDDEISLIDNVVDYNLDFFQEGANSKSVVPNQISNLKSYIIKVCKNLSKILNGRNTNIWGQIYSPNVSHPLSIVSIHFNDKNMNGIASIDDTSDMFAILKKLNSHIYQQHSESIYFRKIVKYYDHDVLFIVKPNEKRFWTEAIALEDSDNISFEMIAQDTNEPAPQNI
jgi:hypothetical protein